MYVAVSNHDFEYVVPYSQGNSVSETIVNGVKSRLPGLQGVDKVEMLDDDTAYTGFKKYYNSGSNTDFFLISSKQPKPTSDATRVAATVPLIKTDVGFNYLPTSVSYDISPKGLNKAPMVILFRPLFFALVHKDIVGPYVQKFLDTNKKVTALDLYGALEYGYGLVSSSSTYATKLQDFADGTSTQALNTFAAVQGTPKVDFMDGGVQSVFKPESVYPVQIFVFKPLSPVKAIILSDFIRSVLSVDDPGQIFKKILKISKQNLHTPV